jgi:hypothetical protein
MRRILSLLLALSLPALLVGADDAPKPNTLTPKEIADGWILLWDGETTFGWMIEGEAKVMDGRLVLGGDKKTVASPTTAFQDFDLRMECNGTANLVFDSGNNLSRQALTSQPTVVKLKSRWTRGPGVTLGDDVEVDKSGTAIHNVTYEHDGPSAFSIVVAQGQTFTLRKASLKPQNTKSLFNGKDLSGWKKFEGNEKQAKSEFSVTKEGWLHIKNGPGDLQTEGQYADFILQVECLTNGDRLNSGVFFRCRPGEYQQGYEAQIHNGWADKPKEYTVEEYDPKTHELKDKKKVPSAALDYGTGAIYRRIPARKAVAKDREWFTMTVAAQGRHIATWVNGMQVVDWMDNRPLKDNARNGCRLEKGNISLQGHDPTTDLSFRNIRIEELAPSKEEK